MSGYFAGLMRQTGIGPAAPLPSPGIAASTVAAPGLASPSLAPPEEHATVDAAPPSSAPPPTEISHAPTPAAAPTRSIPRSPVAGPPIRPSRDVSAPASAPPAPPEVTITRAASPPSPHVSPPAGVPERRVAASREDAAPASPSTPPAPVRGIERTVMREAEPAPSAPPVRAIPSAPPPASRAPDPRISDPRISDPPRTMRVSPAAPVEVSAEVPAPPAPSRVHAFTEVLAEARRWVAATPAPGEPRRPEETGTVEADGPLPAPAGARPRRGQAGITEASEEVHVSIGAITVTIEDPAAARPAPRAQAPRPAPEGGLRLSRVYLRPE